MTAFHIRLLLLGLPVLTGFAAPGRPAVPPLRAPGVRPCYAVAPRMVAKENIGAAADGADGGDSELEAEIDALVRKEVEACFAGLEGALASGDEEKALQLIQTQGKEVLNNVLKQMEDDGKLLSGSIETKVAQMATAEKTELLKKFDAELGDLQDSMAADRATIQQEMQALRKLNDEYQELQGIGGLSLGKDKLIGGVSFLVGLVGLSACVNEGLKIILGAGGDVGTIATNAFLAVAGIGYYFVRTGGSR